MEKIIFYSELGLGNSMSNRVYHEAYDFCCKYFDAEKIAKHFGEKINKEKVFFLVKELKELKQEKKEKQKEILEKFKSDIYKVKVNIPISKKRLEELFDLQKQNAKEEKFFFGSGKKIKEGGFQFFNILFTPDRDSVLVDKYFDSSSIKEDEEYILEVVKTFKDKRGKDVKVVKPVKTVEELFTKYKDILDVLIGEEEKKRERFLEMIFLQTEVEYVIYDNNKEIFKHKKEEYLKDILEKYDEIENLEDISLQIYILQEEKTKEITQKITEVADRIREELKVFYKFDYFLERNGFYRSKIVGCDNDASVIRLTSCTNSGAKNLSLEEKLEFFVDSLQVKITCNEYKNDNTIILSLGSRWYLKIIPEKCMEYIGKSVQEKRNKKQQKEIIRFLKAMIDDLEVEFPSESEEFIKKIEESINKLKNGEDYLNIKEKIIVLIKNIENKELRRYIEDAWLKDIKEELKF